MTHFARAGLPCRIEAMSPNEPLALSPFSLWLRHAVLPGLAGLAVAAISWLPTTVWSQNLPLRANETGSSSGTGANPLVGVTAVPMARQAFHSFCPFAVEAPSVTWVDNAAAWESLLRNATTVPPPYAAGDVSFANQRLMVVASATTPGPTRNLQVMKAPLAVAYSESAQRLSVRVVEIDTPVAAGMMGTTVLGQPCLVLWLNTTRPVREVLARTTTDKLLGRRVLARN
jgi:hypothetical protein